MHADVRSQPSEPMYLHGTKATPSDDGQPMYYVGIGASAGGLEAIEAFFKNMPPQSGLAFILIQHLSPDYKSMMVQLLSKLTQMPVHRAEDGMMVVANAVYLIPPKKKLTIFHGKLILSDPERSPAGILLPIDDFLRSLAEDQGEKAAAIILSGTGSDGMRGVRAIKESGGMVMVQDENTARFDGMPKSAISTGLADFILAPDEMPHQLLAFVEHPEQARSARSDTILTDEDGLIRIFALLRERHKVDFTYYKPSTVVRRIERRMTANHIPELRDYVKFMESYQREQTILYRELLIGVTNFFRDPKAFEIIAKTHLPALMRKVSERLLRFWVAGCSTGEEAYTLAMVCRECQHRLELNLDIKIFATDVDSDAIQYAGNGIYPESIAADLPSAYLSKYFMRREDSFQIARSIREMVVFAQHNLIKDPPFTNIELVSCRNLLIYLQPVLQHKVLNNFNFSLNPGGILFLGHSETIGESLDFFEPLDHKWKIYRSRGKPNEPGQEMDIISPSWRTGRPPLPDQSITHKAMRFHEEKRILDRLLESLSGDYVPLTFVINDQMELLHVLGDAYGILTYPSGRVTNDIGRIVVKDLSIPLATGIQKAFKDDREVRYTHVHIRREYGARTVNMRIKPFKRKKGLEPMAAVFIEHIEATSGHDTDNETLTFDLDKEAAQRIQDLEHELALTRENLQATIEELEASNEELQAANEELLASNEELQSTNQELQSVNEELHTVNAEHQRKIMELTELNNDVRNLMESTDAGTLFIDENLEIRKYTEPIAEIFDIKDNDIGRSIKQLSHSLKDLDPVRLVASVNTSHERLENEVCTVDGRWYFMRIVPYRIGLNTFAGSAMTFINIQELKHSQGLLQTERTKANRQVRLLELISKLCALAEVADATFDKVAEQAVSLIQNLYDQKTVIAAQIAVNGKIYKSSQVESGAYKLDLPIVHDNTRLATLTLFFHDGDADGSDLLQQARQDEVLATIADWMGLIFAKLDSQAALKESEYRLRLLAENIHNVFCVRTPEADWPKFRSIFETATVGIALVDMNGHLLESNLKLSHMLGYSAEELQQRPLVEFSDPQDHDAEMALFKEMASGQRDFFRLRKCFLCKSSEPLQVNFTAILIRDAGGKPGYAIGLIDEASDP
jgi:two-component system CheB/CheR fusion protein